MNSETWKVVRGYEGLYEVSDLGRIRSLGRVCRSKNESVQQKRKRILTQEINANGYCRICLYDREGRSKHFAVHRLVMDAFVGESDLQVNHKNEIKTDNRLQNLEYCTSKENCNYGKRNETISEKMKGAHARGVVQEKRNGEAIRTYSSRIEAEASTGISAINIGRCCAGTRKTAGGFVWRDQK